MHPGSRRLVDADSGEFVHVVVSVPRRRHTGRFFMADQDALGRLVDLDLPRRTVRVLLYLLARLDFENFIHLSQAEVARRLGYDRANVSRAIKQLVEVGIVHRGPRVGTSWTYRLDPDFGFKGRAAQREELRRQLRESRGWDVLEGGQQ